MTDKEKIWQHLKSMAAQLLSFNDSMQEEPTIPDIVDEHFDEMLDEEPVSDDLIQASEEYVSPWQVYAEDTDGELLLTSEPCERAFVSGAQWQKEQMVAKGVDGDITFDYYGDDDKTYGCVAHDSFCLEDFGLKDGDKVKVIVIKEKEQ